MVKKIICGKVYTTNANYKLTSGFEFKPSGEWNINWVGLPYTMALVKLPKAHEILMLISKLMYVEEIF